jgi:hypothetical protein
MTRATQGGTKIATRPIRNVPGGMAEVSRARTDQLVRGGRPAWADDPTLELPCQRPGVDPDWWFEAGTSARLRAIREHAMALCGGCPMQVECRAVARANHEGYGVWGGELMEPLSRPGASQRKGAT